MGVEFFKEYECPVCRKNFVPAQLHRYKIQDKKCRTYFVCSYKCMREVQNGGNKKWHTSKKRVI